MATANIVITQPANPQPVGLAGRSRDDILAGLVVTLSNADDDGVTQRRWELLDIPRNSTAALTSSSDPQTSFIPDLAGTYRFNLGLNSGAAGESQTRVVIVRDSFNRRIPAAGELGPEANYDISGSPNPKGWAPDTQDLLASIVNYTFAKSTGGDFLKPAGSASETFTRIGLGLPELNGNITGHEFFQIMGAGSPPSVNSTAVSTLPGSSGFNLVGVEYDIDTTGCTPGDYFVLVTTAINPGARFVVGTIELT